MVLHNNNASPSDIFLFHGTNMASEGQIPTNVVFEHIQTTLGSWQNIYFQVLPYKACV